MPKIKILGGCRATKCHDGLQDGCRVLLLKATSTPIGTRQKLMHQSELATNQDGQQDLSYFKLLSGHLSLL